MTSRKPPAPGKPPDDEPKIILDGAASDDSWKTKARQEKERLQAEPDLDLEELPPASFLGLVEELSVRVLFALGHVVDPRTGAPQIDLEGAKYAIDLLEVVEKKTRGNLDPDEEAYLGDLLTKLRLAFAATVKNSTSAAGDEEVEPPPPGSSGSIIV